MGTNWGRIEEGNARAAVLVHTRFIRLKHRRPEVPAPRWRKAPGMADKSFEELRKKAGQAERFDSVAGQVLKGNDSIRTANGPASGTI
jgi:hypothetical protein